MIEQWHLVKLVCVISWYIKKQTKILSYNCQGVEDKLIYYWHKKQ